MADIIYTNKQQSKAEIRQWDFDFTADLLDGVTVSSATASHTPPSGNASTPTVGVIVGAIIPVSLGPLSVIGMHLLNVLATLSNGEKSEIMLVIKVNF